MNEERSGDIVDTVIDPLQATLLDLLYELREANLPLILGGGYGLFLRQKQVIESGERLLLTTVPPLRSTNDLDFFLRTELMADSKRLKPLREALDHLGFTVVASAQNYQFARVFILMYGILGGTPRYHALVDTTRPLAEAVVELLLRPRAVLESEVRFLLSSEQIRDPAPYNAVLGAIATGETQFGTIQQKTGVDKNKRSFYLNTLQELGWIRREVSVGDTSERRALYQTADPFLAFWYRFVAPSASAIAVF